MLHPELQKLSFKGETLESVHSNQEAFFNTGGTLSYSFRMKQLEKLEAVVKRNEKRILEAVKKDLRKPTFEGYFGDVGLVLSEITYLKKNLKKLMKPKRVATPMASWPAHSKVESCPLGKVLIIGPWNYPVQLTLLPLVGAIAAGNTAVIKPSELSPNCSSLIAEMIGEAFPEDYIAVFEGDVDVSTMLLEQPWDHIFFTGSTPVGRIVAQKAAEHLTPTTLELGGKSPVFVTANANVDLAAKRIAFGKFFNAGQTCVTADYILVDQKVKQPFLESLKKYTQQFLGEDPQKSDSFARIINTRHHQRLMGLIDGKKVFFGGKGDEKDLYIEPTVLENVAWTDKVMEDEIFGPILPVMAYDSLDKVISVVQKREKALALYVFSNSKVEQKRITGSIRYGGGCINDITLHVASHFLPFGGVGQSGQGKYHGKYSFETFSHQKAVLTNPTAIDLPVRYPPYRPWKEKVLKLLL